MEDLKVVDIALLVGVFAYALYLISQNIRVYVKNVRIRKEYLDTHIHYKLIDQYKGFLVFFALFSIVSLVCACLVSDESYKNEVYTRVAFVLISAVTAGMAIDSIAKRRIITDEDGFVYETEYYRYRSIISMNSKKGLVKNMDILLNTEKHIFLSKKMGAYLEGCYASWKKRKRKKQ